MESERCSYTFRHHSALCKTGQWQGGQDVQALGKIKAETGKVTASGENVEGP